MNNESDNKLVLLNVETVKEKQSEEEGTERKNEENNDNNGKNYQIITHQGNVMVNHISIKKVEQNFNTAQKIELNSQHSKSKEEIESVKEEVKEEEVVLSVQQIKKGLAKIEKNIKKVVLKVWLMD